MLEFWKARRLSSVGRLHPGRRKRRLRNGLADRSLLGRRFHGRHQPHHVTGRLHERHVRLGVFLGLGRQ
jgi:hypothetical protein